MRIGLIDVDCHASKKKWGATIYPNLALAKIAKWHKQQGDEVEWALPWTHYDILYVSKIFNFSPDIDLLPYIADRIEKGGTGYDVAKKLPDEIDHLQPDYSIYPHVPKDTAYGFLTRGCPNSCPWCVVPRKEGKVHPYMDIDEIATEGIKKVVLMDNNVLAAGEYCMTQLRKIIDRRLMIDFNQAIDARLVNETNAQLLAKVRWIKQRIRFGCDTKAQIASCERAMQLLHAAGFKGEFFLYTMIGGKNDFAECYERIHYWWQRLQDYRHKHEGMAVYAYAQPYRDPTKMGGGGNSAMAERYGLVVQQEADIHHCRFQGFLATKRVCVWSISERIWDRMKMLQFFSMFDGLERIATLFYIHCSIIRKLLCSQLLVVSVGQMSGFTPPY